MAATDKRTQWRQRVLAWERSGLSRRAWCARHGVNLHTLDYWRRRLRDDAPMRARAPARAGLMPLRVAAPAQRAAPAPTAGVIEVLLPGGIGLRVPAAMDADQVAALVRALSRC